MERILIVGLGGFLGAIARFGLSSLFHRYAISSFPLGTLAVNLLGCLIIGALISLIEQRELFAANTRLFLMIGLLGSFTTFSAVGYETFDLVRTQSMFLAFGNIAANIILGIGAVAAGWGMVRMVSG